MTNETANVNTKRSDAQLRPAEATGGDATEGETAGSRPVWKRWLIAVAVVALLAAIAARLSTRPEELADLRRLSTTLLLATVLFQLAAQLFWNGAMLLPLRAHMKRLGYWELFMVRTGGLAAGYVVPIANLTVRMGYLKLRGLTYSEFAWATALSNALALFSGALLAALAVGVLRIVAGPPPVSILGLTAGVLALGVAGIAVLESLPGLAGHARLRRWRRLSSISRFRAERGLMAGVLALLLARHSFNFLTFGLLFESLSAAPIGLLTGGLVYAVTSPVRILTITPGNLGVNEWLVAAVANMLSFDLTTGLIAALVFRGVSLVGQLVGVLFGAAWLALHGAATRPAS